MIYNICILLTFISSFIIFNSKIRYKSKKKIMCIAIFIIWYYIMAFRNLSIGTDTFAYSRIFVEISKINNIINLLDSKNVVYTLYNKIISFISNDPQFVVIFNSFIIIGVTLLFLYFNSNNITMSWFYFVSFGYFFFSMNTAKQLIAVTIVMNAYYYIINRNFKIAISLIMIATFIHSTSFVFIIILLISLKKLSLRYIGIVMVFISIFCVFSFSLIIPFVSTFFPNYAYYFNEEFKYSLNNWTSDGGRIGYAFIYIICILLLIRYYIRKGKEESDDEILLLILIMSVSVISILVFRKNGLFARIEWNFSIFAIILIPKVIEICFTERTKYLIYTVSIAVMMFPCVALYQPDFLPYLFFWE